VGTITPFLKDEAFDPKDVTSMSIALDEVCRSLNIGPEAQGVREVIAIRIIELVRRGERSPTRLRDRILQEDST
jgi:hypothetical protein